VTSLCNSVLLKCISLVNTVKANGGVELYLHLFLTFVVYGGEYSAAHPDRFTPEVSFPGTQWMSEGFCITLWKSDKSPAS